jgi:4-amino-4-deoxy-L-arabinose transferase-like glycosyltransferase
MSRFAWRPVAAITLATAAVLAVTVNQYGLHRDELYFLVLSHHPAWGYVDQPPLTPMLIRLSTELFGDAPWAVRLPAIVFGPLAIPVFALLARELGGGRAAQVLAAAGGFCAFVLVSGHIILTTTVDIPVSGLVLLFAIKALRDDGRWWIAVGVVTGLSLYNKQLTPLLLLGIAAGLLIAGPRRVLFSPWLWTGVAVAVIVGLPNVLYQLTHGFPQLDMASALSEDKGGDNRILFFPLQILLLGVTLLPMMVAGFITLLRDRQLRSLAWAYVVVAAFVFAGGSAPYYTFGLVMPLFAAGCVATARWAGGRRWRWALVVPAVVVSELLGAVVALPLVPVEVLKDTPIGAINQTARDQIGWPSYVRQIEAARPPGAPIIANNYGEYGALDYHGVRGIYSGHNQLRYYGEPPATANVVEAIGFDDATELRHYFGSCVDSGRLDSGTGVDNEEQGRTIWVCRDPVVPWPSMWPQFFHYG